MRIVVALLLGFLALNAFGGGIYGMTSPQWHGYFIPSLILCVIVGGAAAVASVATFTEHIFWRLLAYAAALVALVFVLVELAVMGYQSWLQPVVIAWTIAIAVLTWAAPLRPRRSRLDHLASSSARTA